ncbi:MAG: bifunctional DNA-formamidopyrimidine glycosylase/DNA-(apurinic or apyrimidinic site) lyase [bacterium]|nr:bifunctional DNA-formamidopyrimidine glycosylase/DNA-(apurinic or apyrimidinic site) lyase [bacterium]
MPELPEVETVRRGLEELLPGRVIKNITHDWDKSFPNPQNEVKKFAIGARIIKVRRRAKVLMIDLSTEYSFVIHLKMTGQLVFRGEQNFGAGHPNNSLIGNLPDKSTRVILEYKDATHLFFNDQRKFGWVRLMPTILIPEIDFMKKVGPEPLEKEFSPNTLYERLQKRKNSNIKAALLDQTVLAGIGNIYADESLWGASIHPATLVKNVAKSQINKLYTEIVYVLNLAIEKGGSTDRNYVNAEGKRGSYIDFARVFRKENLPCPRCATTIIKIRVAGRGTHICEICQPL